ncbi:hypothetical protein QLS91_08085 [Flavobacterium sp. LB2P84]|uniref:hypothetical protein n=1 Tax=Flavobacterium yafengii TaxID=3041253 RepID=UPI0024A93684|nr:hypothetical protein [Flavobacterium yafengii]MDI6033031.1 hypothetical protein [Flavobacterium yafengii]
MKNNTTKFHPILFATPMVQAIQEGRKTQTRRIIKDELLQNSTPDDDLEFLLLTIRYKYKVGDVLWVRETFRAIEQEQGSPRFEYKATEKINRTDKWKPSLFMPKQACRIFLKIQSIRVERLKEITHWDSIAEGVEVRLIDGCEEYKDYLAEGVSEDEPWGETYFPNNPKPSFLSLWESINGKESLEKNPFVWVYEFEKIEKPLDFI